MYNIKPQEYFTDIFKFLRNENDNKLNVKNLALYVFSVLIIVSIGQIFANNSDPYKSENIENEKFIKDKIKLQLITDRFKLPTTQTYFNSYYVIKLSNNSNYRINLVNKDNEDKIVKNAFIEKKVNNKTFEIINNNIKYEFEIKELNNNRDKIFVFFFTLLLSIVGIPLWIKKNELEKMFEKNLK